ncbi:MAG: hypothetical protein HGB11_14790 [Chlorobiales bacterium]|nr:hypothetical protein [Chlorobiales bacterium]
MKKRIEASGVLPKNRLNNYDVDQLCRSLHNAWGTESLLLATKNFITDDELVRLSNNWSCVQTYYVFYHCTQAYAIARGYKRPENHPKTQTIFYDTWTQKNISLPPWSLCTVFEESTNIPSGVEINIDIHAWSSVNSHTAWDIAAKSLCTTRRDELKERLLNRRKCKQQENKRAWEDEEKQRIISGKRARNMPNFPLPKLTQIEKVNIDKKLRPYTIMDYLYRLRIKTNYVDSNMFTDGPEDEVSSRNVQKYLYRLDSATMLLHELCISRITGPQDFKKWMSAWISKNVPSGMKSEISARMDYID